MERPEACLVSVSHAVCRGLSRFARGLMGTECVLSGS